jgi:hypothetical protein
LPVPCQRQAFEGGLRFLEQQVEFDYVLTAQRRVVKILEKPERGGEKLESRVWPVQALHGGINHTLRATVILEGRFYEPLDLRRA